MGNGRKLSRPPIVEAIIDFKMAGSPVEASILKDLADNYRPDSWGVRENLLVEIKVDESRSVRESRKVSGLLFRATHYVTTNLLVEIKVDESRSVRESRKVSGYIVSGPEQKTLISFDEERVSASHAHLSYTEWEKLREEAFCALEKYSERTKNEKIERIGVRFINRFPISEARDGQKILSYAFCMNGLGSRAVVESFAHRVAVEDPDTNMKSVVTAGIASAIAQVPGLCLVIDIDVALTGMFTASRDVLIAPLELLRTAKNEIFFSNVAAETLRDLS